MNCTRARQVLDAWIDGELDDATAADTTRHVDHCPACLAARADRDALRRQLRAEAPYYSASPALHTLVLERLAESPAPARSAVAPRASLAAVAGVALLVGLLTGYWLARPLPDNPVREQIVASHVAALGDPQRLVTVQSTDQHVVKPWLQGKIDFAPLVRDLGAEGYTLLGARLDHIGEQQGVAIVYRMRNHVINLFAWRAAGYTPQALAMQTARGFGMATWSVGGLHYAAVSDLERGDLERFAQLLQTP
jgi:anti-sigma factor RsiW